MILPSDTDVAVSLRAGWISDIVQATLGLESRGRIQSQVRKRAVFFSGAFAVVCYLFLSLLYDQHTFFRAPLYVFSRY